MRICLLISLRHHHHHRRRSTRRRRLRLLPIKDILLFLIFWNIFYVNFQHENAYSVRKTIFKQFNKKLIDSSIVMDISRLCFNVIGQCLAWCLDDVLYSLFHSKDISVCSHLGYTLLESTFAFTVVQLIDAILRHNYLILLFPS